MHGGNDRFLVLAFHDESFGNAEYVVVGDQDIGGQGVSAIYQTTGAGGKIVHKTPIDDPTDPYAEDIVGFWIDGQTVVGANNDGNDIGFFKYPAGGKPTKTLDGIDVTH